MNANHPTPPRWAERLLEWFCAPHLLEEVQGDLHERFTRRLDRSGQQLAYWQYAWEVLGFLRPVAIRRQPAPYSSPFIISPDMLRSYLKIALRQLWRNRLFTGLNVVGLSIGLSACWVIFRIVSFEFSFDTPNPNRAHIARVVSRFVLDGKEQGNSGTPLPMANAVRSQISGVDRVIPIRGKRMEQVLIPQKAGNPLPFGEVTDVVATDTNYFRMVPYHWLAGDSTHALNQPRQVVLTQSRAARYFPGLSPRQILNQTIVYWDTLTIQVAGVVVDLPYLSDFKGNEFLSVSTLESATNPDQWGSTNSDDQLFLMLYANTDPKQVEAQINALSKKSSAEEIKKWGNFQRWHLLQPLADLHFGVDYDRRTHRANKSVLLGLIALAGFILVLAIINYVNLASAQVPQRAREIGIRKTLGSRRCPLIFQFLGETAATTVLAFGVAYTLSWVFFRSFSDLIPEGIATHTNWLQIALFLACLLLGVTLLAGLYPGWLIARLQPVAVLRGQTGYTTTQGHSRLTLRKSLIVFQFFVAQFFIVGSLIVNQQLQYALRADMGFARDAVLTVSVPWKSAEYKNINKRFVLKETFQKLPGVAAVSLGNPPASDSYSSNSHELTGKKGKVEVNIFRKYTDADYLSFYKIPLLAGRVLQPSDTAREYVINETAAKAFGFNQPQEAVGAFLKENGGQKIVPIVGVVRDFHSRSFR